MVNKLSDYYIRKNLVHKLSKKMCKVHPNIVTILNFIVAIFIFFNVYKKQPYYVIILLSILNRYLDMLDGEIAKSCDKQSKLGAILDIIGDIILYLTIFIMILYKTYKGDIRVVTKVLISLFFIPISIFCLYTVYLELNTKSWIKSMNKDKHKNLLHTNILIYRDNAFVMGILILVFSKFVNNRL
jgi:phosphatidylglycerophosphate synthase